MVQVKEDKGSPPRVGEVLRAWGGLERLTLGQAPRERGGLAPRGRVKEANMRIAKGNFLAAARGVLLAPGNGVVRADGHLVMGAGAAKALARAYPHLPRVFGRMARGRPNMGGWYLYGLLVIQVAPGLSTGLFQTKGDWRDRADLSLITYSARRLAEWLRNNPGQEAHLAFPGVGLGGLEEEEVLEVLEPILKDLPTTLYKL